MHLFIINGDQQDEICVLHQLRRGFGPQGTIRRETMCMALILWLPELEDPARPRMVEMLLEKTRAYLFLNPPAASSPIVASLISRQPEN